MTTRIEIPLTLAAAAFISLALHAAPVRAQAPASPATGNPGSGKKLYEAYSCYACHGFNGETGARAFVSNRSATLATEANFISFLRARANLAPTQPSTSMPNYSAATLSDPQARDIYAYVRTFKSTAPLPDQIPVFNQILTGSQRPYKP